MFKINAKNTNILNHFDFCGDRESYGGLWTKRTAS